MIVNGLSAPDFLTADELARCEPPMSDREQLHESAKALWLPCQCGCGDRVVSERAGMYEYADTCSIPDVSPGEWFLAARRRRARSEEHPIARYLAGHADRHTGKNVRCSVQRMAQNLGRSRENCNRQVRTLFRQGWLRHTGKAARGVNVYALAIPD